MLEKENPLRIKANLEYTIFYEITGLIPSKSQSHERKEVRMIVTDEETHDLVLDWICYTHTHTHTEL